MKVRRGLTGCAVLVVVGLSAACEDSPEAGTVETPTATIGGGSAESAEPETAEPTSEGPTEPVPELTEVPGEEPEITFVKHFFDVYVYARQTGDVEPFLKLSKPNCESCTSGANWISDKYDAGGYVEGGDYELREEPELADPTGQPEVRISYRESPITVVEAEGESPEVLPACDLLIFTVHLDAEGDQWLVDQFTVQSPC